MKEYPTKSDLFGMQSVYDYKKIILGDTNQNKVIRSKKSFIKATNKKVNKRLFRTQNK